MEIELFPSEKQFIRDNKDLIDDENWDEFFKKCSEENDVYAPRVYQFLMFEAGIDLLHKMTYIFKNAFEHCPYRLGDLVIPSNITLMDFCAFDSCKTLTSIDLSKTKIKEIDALCFTNCKNLKEVVLPKTCCSINVCAFSSCKNLEAINLENVTTIKERGFAECNLDSIVLNDSVNIIAFGNVFEENPLTNITTPKKYAKKFKKDFPNANIKVI